MSELLILRGIPASGKSTFAKEWVAEDPDSRVRINRDDIRFMLFGKYWGVNERAVTAAQDSLLRAYLVAGMMNVVLDNTNLRSRDVKRILKIAAEYNATVTFKDFPIELGTAVFRDAQRERKVGPDVIGGFFNRFTPKGIFPPVPTLDTPVSTAFEAYAETPGLPVCILVDIDGTLAHMDDRRGPYDYTKYHLDRLDEVVKEFVSFFSTRYYVVIMSGRDETYRTETEEWLGEHGVYYDELYMRPTETGPKKTEDSIVKNRLFEQYIKGRYNVRFVLDDRDRVVAMWRAKGLKVLQVEPGDF